LSKHGRREATVIVAFGATAYRQAKVRAASMLRPAQSTSSSCPPQLRTAEGPDAGHRSSSEHLLSFKQLQLCGEDNTYRKHAHKVFEICISICKHSSM
jgi:hypothetical protein